MTKQEQDKYKKWLIIGGAVFLGYKFLKPLSGLSSTLGNVIATKGENVSIKASTGLNDEEITLVRTVANNTYAAMYQTGFWQFSWFGGSTEDESKVISELNRLQTGAQAQLCSDFYKTVSGDSLAAHLNKYLDSAQRQKIKSVILANIS